MLRRAAVTGAVWGMAAQVIQVAVTLGALLVLARLLGKEEFGLAAMVLVVNGLVGAVADLGMNVPAIRQDRVDQRRAAWIAAAAGLASCLLVALGAPAVVAAYGHPPGLAPLLRAGALALLLAGLASTARARLMRALRFRALFLVDVAVVLAAAGGGVLLAWRGLGAWALVLADVGAGLVATALLWLLAPRAAPGPEPPSVADGVRVAGTRAADSCFHHVDRFLVGSLLGAASLGLYRFGLQHTLALVQRLTQVAEQVALPVFSRLRHEPARLRASYCALTRLFALLVVPGAVLGWFLAPWVVDLLYPARWLEAVPVMRAFCVAAVAAALNSHPGVLWLALGDTRLRLLWSLANLAALGLVVPAGARYGIEGVAYALAVRSLLAAAAAQVLTRRRAGVAHADYVRALSPAVGLGALLGLITWALCP